MNTVRPSRTSFLRAARLVLLAALSAGTLGLSGCGGGVSVGVGIGIDAAGHYISIGKNGYLVAQAVAGFLFGFYSIRPFKAGCKL